MASAFYGDPSRSMLGVAVTGTNGKTTTTHWIAELLSLTGTRAAVLGTVGCVFEGRHFDLPALTTPDAISLQTVFADLRAAGAEAFAVEASSIGLEQGRMKGTHFDTAVFTNLTRDHLDYHKTMEAYGDAKTILFAWPDLKHAVVNADDPFAATMTDVALSQGVDVWAVGTQPITLAAQHVMTADNIRADRTGTAFTLHFEGRSRDLCIPQVGFFNVTNLMEAMAVLMAKGVEFEALLPLVSTLTPPPGRMQLVVKEGVPMGVVDYSHTPDALEKALESLRPVAEARGGRLWVVFGCGGDRDTGKRPVMGEIACRLADNVVVTSDNPRTESPEKILKDILQGAPSASCIEDRRSAIVEAFSQAQPADVILVAGKGHEDYQDVMGVKYPFSDVEVVREVFNDLRVRYFRSQEK
ncbi:UDP-N-acetylmuramoylalanyl-D-glutamate--2, 6-diaminopimelate ligase [gut metagenome]|uniref:UDP-N-acetylmuramoylalanyl-D-glutamate--2, 6-diaminopimelate ligase n=1 Tax=gut metagenome TaxID=749906 RepID=J9D3W2_9ZZZZ